MPTAAITGATGFIGRHVVPLLLDRGYNVRALMRPKHQDLVSGVDTIPGDVTEPTTLEALTSNCDIVLHLAGQAHTDLNSAEDRERAVTVNVGGTRNLMEACCRNGVPRVVVASSAHVYRGQSGRGIREDAPQEAENLYAQTKVEVEKLVREFSASGLNVVIGRPSLTYGPNARFNLHRLLHAVDRGVYFHVGHRRVERSFCSAYSAAAAFVFLAAKGVPGEAYNIADRQPMLLEDFTNDLADRMKRRRPRRIPHAVLWPAAVAFSGLGTVGLKGPITLASLRKLTDSFSITTDKLASLGFVWPDSGDRARQDMVDAYLKEGR